VVVGRPRAPRWSVGGGAGDGGICLAGGTLRYAAGADSGWGPRWHGSAVGTPVYPAWRNDGSRPRFDAGVEWSTTFGITSRRAWVIAPGWAYVVAFGLLPGWRAWRRLRRPRERGGPGFEVVRREGPAPSPKG
jgi:hypothetical protein